MRAVLVYNNHQPVRRPRGSCVNRPVAYLRPHGEGGCLHHVDEGGNVVVGDAFALFHCSHEVGVGGGRLCAAFGCSGGGHDANTYMRLGGEQFDFEEATEARFVAEHRCHLGERVAGNHDQIT